MTSKISVLAASNSLLSNPPAGSTPANPNKNQTMSTSFKNALRKAEGTIARASGGRRSWDSIALCETALSAMRGEKAPCGGSMSPEECDRMMSAFRVIADRTSRAHRFEAEQF